jgi:DNA-binding NarL/FixJ family response regulator
MSAPIVERAAGLHVLLVDDHRLFAEVLARRLALEPRIGSVSCASSIPVAAALLNAARPDVVVLDYDLGDTCGLDLLPTVGGRDDPPEVIVLSGSCNTATMISALRQGARGWVVKENSIDALLTALQEVRRGQISLPRGSWTPVLRSLVEDAPGAVTTDTLPGLTPRQLDVLRCLVAGMTQREAAERLFVSPNTVRTHVQALFTHFDVHTTPALTALARRAGLTAVEPVPPKVVATITGPGTASGPGIRVPAQRRSPDAGPPLHERAVRNA